MAPRRVLPRREPQRREPESGDVHPELGVDQHVEPVAADHRRDHRRSRAVGGKGAEVVGARRDRLRDVVDARPQVIDENLEALAIEVGDPALEIAAAGAGVEERRGESDPHAPAAQAPRGQRSAPLRRDGVDGGGGNRRVTSLQIAIVAPLIGEEEIDPAQPVENLRLGKLCDAYRRHELALETAESRLESRARGFDLVRRRRRPSARSAARRTARGGRSDRARARGHRRCARPQGRCARPIPAPG